MCTSRIETATFETWRLHCVLSISKRALLKRISLSFQGVQLLVVALYNFHETIYNTAAYLDNRQLHLTGSPKAVAGGLIFLLTITSSLYHLTFMSGQRFYAIKWPLKYRINDKTSVIAGLLAVWMLSILSASVPGEQFFKWSFANVHVPFAESLRIFACVLSLSDVPLDWFLSSLE